MRCSGCGCSVQGVPADRAGPCPPAPPQLVEMQSDVDGTTAQLASVADQIPPLQQQLAAAQQDAAEKQVKATQLQAARQRRDELENQMFAQTSDAQVLTLQAQLAQVLHDQQMVSAPRPMLANAPCLATHHASSPADPHLACLARRLPLRIAVRVACSPAVSGLRPVPPLSSPHSNPPPTPACAGPGRGAALHRRQQAPDRGPPAAQCGGGSAAACGGRGLHQRLQ